MKAEERRPLFLSCLALAYLAVLGMHPAFAAPQGAPAAPRRYDARPAGGGGSSSAHDLPANRTSAGRAPAAVQQLSKSGSSVRLKLEGALTLSGRLVSYSGKLDRTPSLESSSVTLSFDLSTIASDPTPGAAYLNPDLLFRGIPNPRVVFTSSRITKKGGSRYLVEGTARRGGRDYPVSIPVTVGRSDALVTECLVSLRGDLSTMQLGGGIPGGFGAGAVDARLVFGAEGAVLRR